ncbi:MAG: GFA family protein [Rhizobiaceae bacterium]|nr:GFA family protein [Rhizobiaceae bacterium]
MGEDEDWRRGACHCGAVRFRVKLRDGLREVRRCDCSFCRMRGAVVATARAGDLEIVEGADKLTLYQFRTNTARHHFCSVCGIYTHHRRRSDPSELGVNVACLEGVSPFDFREVVVNDGINHPSDGGGASDGVAGTLRYFPRG